MFTLKFLSLNNNYLDFSALYWNDKMNLNQVYFVVC